MAATGVVGSLVARIEDEREVVVARIGDRIREEIPDFRRLPADSLAGAVRGNVSRALAALRELREPTPDELERAAEVGRERAEQGLTVDAVLHAYRITITALWSRFGELARAEGADVATVLAFSETLWHWADAVMDVVAAAHREVELEQAREEQQRRDAFVFAVLSGTLNSDELRRESATFGLDPERAYVPFRARGANHRAALTLAGPGGLFIALDHDTAGIAVSAPTAPPNVTVGFASPARLDRLPVGFAREPCAPNRARLRSSRRLLARRPVDPPRDPRRRGPRRRLRRAPPRAAGVARDGARGDAADVPRSGHADRGHRACPARARQHIAPPPAPL